MHSTALPAKEEGDTQWRCGTWGHGLVAGLAVLEQQLDSILEVSCNFNDSMILYQLLRGKSVDTQWDNLTSRGHNHTWVNYSFPHHSILFRVQAGLALTDLNDPDQPQLGPSPMLLPWVRSRFKLSPRVWALSEEDWSPAWPELCPRQATDPAVPDLQTDFLSCLMATALPENEGSWLDWPSSLAWVPWDGPWVAEAPARLAWGTPVAPGPREATGQSCVPTGRLDSVRKCPYSSVLCQALKSWSRNSFQVLKCIHWVAVPGLYFVQHE